MIDKWRGTWDISITNTKTNKIKNTTVKNRITNIAIDELLKVLQGQSANLEIKYLALGTSNAPLDDDDTQLGGEIFRTQLQSIEKTNVGELKSLFMVLDSEAIGQIEEIGLFGGEATLTANSGTMISRILWSRNKTASEEIQFTRIDKIVRG